MTAGTPSPRSAGSPASVAGHLPRSVSRGARGPWDRARVRDRGHAAVAVIGLIIAILALTLGALDVTRSIALAHRARSASDLAALAAAHEAVLGSGASVACERAASVAVANGARIAGCVVTAEGSVTVTVTVASAAPWSRTARAVARAGPG